MTIDQKSKIILFPRIGKIIIIFFALAFLVTGFRAYQLYNYVFQENVKNATVLLIPENASFEQVTDSLKVNDVLLNYKAFSWVSKKKNYPAAIKRGRYFIQKGMNSNQIVNMLRAGVQQPVKVTFNNVRFKEELAGKVSKYIEADSLSILNLFYDKKRIKKYGFTTETFRTMFIPNTYEFYWTTTAEEFADRMKMEYDRFWNDKRKAEANKIGLTPVEVTILASIVQSETAKKDELKRIAGLYMNRLKRGQLLQADPTVKYAVGDFSIKRILNSHLEVDSPYNTYKYVGLPPGPIRFPEISSIDAVLNYEKNSFIYMCAREDFSGYHNFSTTLARHNQNAEKYRAALNRNKIWK
ncbi:MAG: endolytic transglycosylase MltG [Prolixibacteraceae bacterium]|nr:endolytic transglycosylase MltG [Prolixibacteraceae bacterium]